MRKQILGNSTPVTAPSDDLLDIATLAAATITSEDPAHPLENAFDGQRGPGSSYWQAATPDLQTITLAFDTPQTLRQIVLEIEETQATRSQELVLAYSQDGGQTYREIQRQGYNFSPPGTTWEREEWQVNCDRLTHLRLEIDPDKEGRQAPARLTTLILR
ncbi:MAG: discoidin domain-containing protein [Cyanobacteria bacterium J06641_5]